MPAHVIARPALGWLMGPLALLASSAVTPALNAAAPDANPSERYALEFDGETSFAWLKTPLPEPVEEGTVEIWFRLLRPMRGERRMPLFGDHYHRLNLALEGSRIVFYKESGSADNIFVEHPSFLSLEAPVGQLGVGWHHVAGVWGPGGMRLFFDGKRVAARPEASPYVRGTVNGSALGAETLLGQGFDFALGGWTRFEGQMAFVRVSGERLYENDFVPDWASPAASSNELIRYDFREGTGHVLRDATRREQDGRVGGCVWRRFDPAPKVPGSPLPEQIAALDQAPILLVPFSTDPSQQIDSSQLEGFHLTASWLLNYFGRLPVVTEAEVEYWVPRARFPYRNRFELEELSGVRERTGASALVWGYLEPELQSRPGDESVRLTVYVWRTDAPRWETTLTFDGGRDTAYGEAQRQVAAELYELLTPEARRIPLEGLDKEDAPLSAQFQWDQTRELLLRLDSFSLVQAIFAVHGRVVSEPRYAESWRLLAEAYGWLGGPLETWYDALPLRFRGRARAAHNIAVLLEGLSPACLLNRAAIQRLGGRLGPAFETARALDPFDFPAREGALLALALSRESILDEFNLEPAPFYPLIRGWIRQTNHRPRESEDPLAEAWELNPLVTVAPGLALEPRTSQSRYAMTQRAVAPGVHQASRLILFASLLASQETTSANEYLRYVVEVFGQPPRVLPDEAARRTGAEVIDHVVQEAIPLQGTTTVIPVNEGLDVLALLCDLQHNLCVRLQVQGSGIHAIAEAARLSPERISRIARREAQSGIVAYLRLFKRNETYLQNITAQMLDHCGFDDVTVCWAFYAQ